jgi:hypothetical protein
VLSLKKGRNSQKTWKNINKKNPKRGKTVIEIQIQKNKTKKLS